MRPARIHLSFLTLLAAMVLAAPSARAQSSSLSGVVTDETGGILPDAEITVINEANNVQRTVLSNEEGTVRLRPAPSRAPTTCRATQPGFNSVTIEGITLLVNTNLELSVVFDTVATLTRSITVSATAPQLNTTDASVGNAFGTKPIRQPAAECAKSGRIALAAGGSHLPDRRPAGLQVVGRHPERHRERSPERPVERHARRGRRERPERPPALHQRPSQYAGFDSGIPGGDHHRQCKPGPFIGRAGVAGDQERDQRSPTDRSTNTTATPSPPPTISSTTGPAWIAPSSSGTCSEVRWAVPSRRTASFTSSTTKAAGMPATAARCAGFRRLPCAKGSFDTGAPTARYMHSIRRSSAPGSIRSGLVPVRRRSNISDPFPNPTIPLSETVSTRPDTGSRLQRP